jgi:hypothetical protein
MYYAQQRVLVLASQTLAERTPKQRECQRGHRADKLGSRVERGKQHFLSLSVNNPIVTAF